MKKIFIAIGIIIAISACFFAWLLFGSATHFETKEKILYIYPGHTKKHQVMQQLKDSGFIRNLNVFEMVAERSGVWKKIAPGRYAITHGMSIVQLARDLRNQKQSPVKLTITKLRTKAQFAALLDKKFLFEQQDVMQLLQSNAFALQYALDTNTIMTLVLPNTYELLWTATPEAVLKKLADQKTLFWNETRRAKAKALQLSPESVYILASIVEEETNQNVEKPIITSVYLNRLRKQMNLGADPTVKFALQDFSLKRIRFVHITRSASNPYNTYKNKGLPPGPICTPSEASIDAVLNAANTDYLFFCAQPGGTGLHNFASNEKEHFQNAKAYQQWLNRIQIK